jgi:hypothetical protein
MGINIKLHTLICQFRKKKATGSSFQIVIPTTLAGGMT